MSFGTLFRTSGVWYFCPSPEAFPAAGRGEHIFSSNLYILLGISTRVGEWLEMPRANSQDNTGSMSRSEER